MWSPLQSLSQWQPADGFMHLQRQRLQLNNSQMDARMQGKAPQPPSLPADAETVTEAPPSGSRWQTAEMESGRRVWAVLLAEPPAPLPSGRQLGVLMATLEDRETGETKLRLLLLPVRCVQECMLLFLFLLSLSLLLLLLLLSSLWRFWV